MDEPAALLILQAAGAYLGTGLAFGLAFIFLGIGKIDPVAKAMPLRVRLVLLPGTAALWPLMLAKWVRQTEPPVS